MPELSELLDHAAEGPTRPVDLNALGRRSRQLRRRRRTFTALAGVVPIALITLATGLIDWTEPGGRVDTVAATTEPPPTGSTSTGGDTMPDYRHLDYRDAVDALQRDLGRTRDSGLVLLSLDVDAEAPTGVVTRTDPAAGSSVAPEAPVVVHVAGTRRDFDFDGASSATSGERALVISNNWFPPLGLHPGAIDGPSPECSPPHLPEDGQAVRFLHGELVGCMTRMFVWLHQLPTADEPVATMPDVVGLTFDAAKEQLRLTLADLRGMELEGGGVPGGEPGIVARTEPAGGEPISRLTAVRLFVGLGSTPTSPSNPPTLIPVRDVSGLLRASAETILRSDGLQVAISTEASATIPVDRVIRTDPGPGSHLHPGQLVTLVVSTGPRPSG